MIGGQKDVYNYLYFDFAVCNIGRVIETEQIKNSPLSNRRHSKTDKRAIYPERVRYYITLSAPQNQVERSFIKWQVLHHEKTKPGK